MQVLMLAFRFYPLGDGTERQALALSHALQRQGVGVSVATARFRGLSTADVLDGVGVDRLLYAPDRRRLRRLANYTYLGALGRHLLRRADAVDLFHCHMATFHIIPAILAGRHLGRPVVVKIACAGSDGDVARLRRFRADPAGELGRLTALLLHRASAIIAPSTEIYRELTAQGYRRVHRLPNGVDIQRFRPATSVERDQARSELGLPPNTLLVGFMGRLEKQKAVDVLITAWLRSSLPSHGALLCIAGVGQEEAALRRALDGLGDATRSVRFLGRVEPTLFLRALDMFVLPSRFEGMPNVLLEAMASGLACVGTRIGGTEDLIRDGISGLLVAADQVSPLVAALEHLSNPELRGRLSGGARLRAATEFSLDGVAQRYRELYRELLVSFSNGTRYVVRRDDIPPVGDQPVGGFSNTGC